MGALVREALLRLEFRRPLPVTRRSALYALAGSIVSIWVYIAMSAILNTVGLPAMTSGMAITIALVVLGAQTYEGLNVIPLESLGRPEDNLGRRS
ncbi:MAG: hypothetical protein ACR2OH_07075 [Microthrixaceae bacterium]